jgi:hypothetical protein
MTSTLLSSLYQRSIRSSIRKRWEAWGLVLFQVFQALSMEGFSPAKAYILYILPTVFIGSLK